MIVRSLRLVALLGLCGSLASTAVAQGTFGARTVGGGVTGSSGGASATRDSGLAQTGTVTAAGAVQRSDTGFVGASTQNVTAIGSMMGGTGGTSGMRLSTGLGGTSGLGGLGGLSGLSGLGGRGMSGLSGLGGMGGMNMFGQGGANSRTNTQKLVRAPLRLAPEMGSVIQPTAAAQQFTTRLARLPVFSKAQGVTVSMDGETVVLQGVVATEHDREVLARLALLEPGIAAVRNELVVNPQALPAAP